MSPVGPTLHVKQDLTGQSSQQRLTLLANEVLTGEISEGEPTLLQANEDTTG